MKLIYRISNNGYLKEKPKYINNRNCLWNAINTFSDADWYVIADNINNETYELITNMGIFPDVIDRVSVGHGAGTFNLALDKALTFNDNDTVYFLENDYLHLPDSSKIIDEALDLGADYVTLYLHPDKFIPGGKGGNPYVDNDGGYVTKIYRGNNCLFGVFDSTTMTFAAKVKTLREDESILRQYTTGSYPQDFSMFTALRNKQRTLLCPLNSYSTHGETKYLAPFVKWNLYA